MLENVSEGLGAQKCVWRPKCPKMCMYPKCIFAKCIRLACLLSFVSLFSLHPFLNRGSPKCWSPKWGWTNFFELPTVEWCLKQMRGLSNSSPYSHRLGHFKGEGVKNKRENLSEMYFCIFAASKQSTSETPTQLYCPKIPICACFRDSTIKITKTHLNWSLYWCNFWGLQIIGFHRDIETTFSFKMANATINHIHYWK